MQLVLQSGQVSPPFAMASRAEAAQAFPWTIFGMTVASVLQDPIAQGARDLDCAELFCGVGAIWRAAQRAGLSAAGYDLNRIPGETNSGGARSEDICCVVGFLNALAVVLRLRAGALLWVAPMCNSFCWLALSRTRRFDTSETNPCERSWWETAPPVPRHF